MYNIIRKIIFTIILIIKRDFLLKRIYYKVTPNTSKTLWINLSSVGEANLVEPLISRILKESEYEIFITVMTDTGMEILNKRYNTNNRISISYFPLDSSRVIKKILKLKNIAGVVLIETEIWPNMINCASKKVPVFMINGRISDKTYKNYLQMKWFFKNTLEKLSLLMMQSEKDKERIINIGALKERVIVTGNMKFDVKYDSWSEDELLKIRRIIGAENKKIITAGSTHKGEEEFIVNVSTQISNSLPIIVPRHLDRIDEVITLLKDKKREVILWSEIEKNIEKNIPIETSTDNGVLVINKMGLLRKFYNLADIIFVGGTIAKVGGHSLLEPLYYGKIPLFGENIQNTRDIAKEIEKRGIGFVVKNEEEFVKRVTEIDGMNSDNIKNKIKDFFDENSNAIEKNFKNIVDIVEKVR